MTTLFNLFCPLITVATLKTSVMFLVLVTMIFLFLMLDVLTEKMTLLWKAMISFLFTSSFLSLTFTWSLFAILMALNAISLVTYSYPVTTTLSLNLGTALFFWLVSIVMFFMKKNSISSLLPLNSPWYLASFLSLVEMVSISVRPLTLCFRLLANMSAGHILLSLVCKLQSFMWVSGVMLGLLELMVSLVQAFVFSMLVVVYLEESFSH